VTRSEESWRELEVRVEQLEQALHNRPRIEHAVGMIMMLMPCDEPMAVAALKQVSMTTNRKLIDVADLITSSIARGAQLPTDVADALALVLPPRRPGGVPTQAGTTSPGSRSHAVQMAGKLGR